MNDIQKHLIGLLQEIDTICAENNIPYLLGGRTAKDACQNRRLLGEYAFASVMMRGQDFDKFRNAVAKREGRAVESLLENPDYPDGQSMRYVDENTTFLYGHTAHRYRHKGIFVTIQKCRRVPKNKHKAKMANAIDNLLSAIGADELQGNGTKKRLMALAVRAMLKVMGKPRMIRLLLKIQRRLIRGGSSLAFLRPGKPNISIPSGMFTDAQRVELEGAAFYVPTDADAYLKKVFGKDWMTDDKPEPLASPHLLVCSTQVSYKNIDNDDAVYTNRAQVNAVIQKRKVLSNRVQELRGCIEKYWDLLFLTKERYELYRRYMPVLPMLQERLAQSDYAWLNEALVPYMETVNTYLAKGLPVVTHPDLDDVVLEVLKYQGAHGLAQKFRTLKAKMAFRALSLPLNETDRIEALRQLPATITVEEDAAIPAFLRCGERLLRVALPNEEGAPGPVLVKHGNAIRSVADRSAQALLIQNEDGHYVPFFGSQWDDRLLADGGAIPLVQHTYERDVELAWLDADGRLYTVAAFGTDGLYTTIDLPKYIAVTAEKEVPLYYFDTSCATLRRVFGLDSAGQRVPVATLGLGGTVWVTPGVADTLHIENDNGEMEAFTVHRFVDAAREDVQRALGRMDSPTVCCSLVQEDAFGRLIEVAGLCADGRVLPMVRVADDGTAMPLALGRSEYATLCLKQNDGTEIPLVSVDHEGAIVFAAKGQKMPIQALIDGMKP